MSDLWIPADHPLVFDTPYAHILVFDQKRKKEPIRYFLQSGAYGSASFLRPEKRNELVFNYLHTFDRVLSWNLGHKLLLIGGAGYQFPKYVLSHHPDRNLEVVEIDAQCLKIAKTYFFLDDCLHDYDPDGKRFRPVQDDGRAFLKSRLAARDRTYDIIFNDAFGSYYPAPDLATKEAAETVKQLLNPGGLYVVNTLGTPKGPKGRFLRSAWLMLSQVFPFVYVLAVPSDQSKRSRYTNHILVAAETPLRIPDAITLRPELGDLILMDKEDPGIKITEMVMGHYRR